MQANEVQQQLFHYLKSISPPHISLPDQLAQLLNLSHDSVYRRIRGEKPLELSELKQICECFRISLDEALNLQNDTVLFQAAAINNPAFAFTDFLKGLLSQLKYFNSFKERKIWFMCSDLPFWKFYMFPEIATFKTFFWRKTLLNEPAYAHKSFSLAENAFAECFELGQEINKEYSQIASVEFWNKDSITSTLIQIEYYRDARLFKSWEDFESVIDSFEKTLDHLELQAQLGMKVLPANLDTSFRGPLQLYISEVSDGNTAILVELDNAKHSFILYNVFNYLATRDVDFGTVSFQAFENLVRRSTLVSATGEKERIRFFHLLKERVWSLKR